MRLSSDKASFLKNTIKLFRPSSKIYLFGSRTNDSARGGDIDILILTEKKLNLKELSKIERSFYQKYGEQKLDLVCFKEDVDHPFKKVAMLTAEEL